MKLDQERPIIEAVGLPLDSALRDLEARAKAVVAGSIEPRAHEESDEAALEMTRALGRAGLLDAGVELDVPAICVLREVVASSSGLADSMLALQGLGYGPIALAGTDAQKERWREPVRRGEAIAAIGITEPNAGSDVAAIETTAVRDGDEWVINGTKHYITNAGIASFYVVIARTGASDDPSESGARGLSAIIVPADRVTSVERYALVAPHPCGKLTFEDVRVPVDHLVGEPGQGFKIAMRTLDHFRTTVAAAAVGMARRALAEATDRAQTRQQFGKPIARFQQVSAHLADMWTALHASRLLVYRAALAFAAGDEAAGLYSSAAKMFATEAAQTIIDKGVQIFGGDGVKQGFVVERLYREIRALRIYEGTTEIQKIVISRGLLG